MTSSELPQWLAALRRITLDRHRGPGGPDQDADTGHAPNDADAADGATAGELATRLTTDEVVGQLVEVGDGDSVAAIEHRVEEAVLGAPRRYSRTQVHRRTGISDQRGRELWRAMGFADVGQDDVVFTDTDLEAIGLLEELRATGLVSTDLQDAVIRSIAQAMAGLATWQVELLYQILAERTQTDEDFSLDLRNLLDALENLQHYVWRRHLAVAAGRLLATAPDEADIRTLVVGSSDLVGFTRTSRRLSPSELIELVEEFHGTAATVVAEHRGRIVKTVGDAVLFVTDRPEDGADIALDLIDRTVEASGLPELRTGLALGETLTRFGDIYGEVVERAARLCTHARPGRVLVDHALATVLDGNPRYRLRPRRPVVERGYPRLHAWGLRRDQSDQDIGVS
jgi:adenylate cyclase